MRVSVIMPSYGHATYIAQSIASVLAQTVEDIELLVVDDASPDGSNEIIRSFDDSRIIHIPLARNVGGSETMNIGLRRASAPLIAVCNSDDVWEPDKLQQQIAVMERAPHIAAVFSNVSWIDFTGRTVDACSSSVLGNFSQQNRPRHAWLRRLAEGGNCLCHPSVLVRRATYEACGVYDRYLRQLPDYDMWLRVLQRDEIHVMPERLVRFRIHHGNTSRSTPDVLRRDARECLFILRKLFDEISPANFRQAFLRDAPAPSTGDEEILPDPRAVLTYLCAYQGPLKSIFQYIALERIYRAPPEIREDVLSVSAFQSAMADPCPTFMSPSVPRVMERFSGTLRRIVASIAGRTGIQEK